MRKKFKKDPLKRTQPRIPRRELQLEKSVEGKKPNGFRAMK